MNIKLTAIIIVLIATAFIGITLAVNPHEITQTEGQPFASCGSEGQECAPGNAGSPHGSSTGSAFVGDSIPNRNYAGSVDNPTSSSDNPHVIEHAVSQYDVGCLEVSQNPSGEHNPGCC